MIKAEMENKKSGNNKKLLFFTSLLVGFVLLIFFYFWIGIKEIFSVFFILKPWQFILIFALGFFSLLFYFKRWQVAIKDFVGFRPSLKKISKFWFMGWAMTYFTPTGHFGGEPVRVCALSREYNCSITKSALTIVIEYTAGFFGIAIFSLLGAVIFFLKKNSLGFLLLFWFLFIVLCFVLFMKLWANKGFFNFIFKLFSLDKIKTNINDSQVSLLDQIKQQGDKVANYIKNFPPYFILAIIYSFIYHLVWLLQAKFFFYFLGVNVSLPQLIFLGTMISIFRLMPIPISLGSFEAAHLLTFSIFGFSLGAALSFSLLGRIMDFTFAGIGLLFGVRSSINSIIGLNS